MTPSMARESTTKARPYQVETERIRVKSTSVVTTQAAVSASTMRARAGPRVGTAREATTGRTLDVDSDRGWQAFLVVLVKE